ncbi:glycosyltransferase family 4 protein [Gracilimonas halophila]|uniref:Glycosyltransferase family 4 protein n=1 Tax=Gracilimonas halophila TaxID=1834464 RepID=A0ABW5JNB4_9BACT
MKKILIIQSKILHYRKALYNKLSESYQISVLHSGKPSISQNDKYREIIKPSINIGPFFFQRGIRNEIKSEDYDVVIAMFDIRWINNVVLGLIINGPKFIYWGHRYSKRIFINSIRNFLIKKSDGVILYNDSEVPKIKKAGINDGKIFIAENTIDVSNSENLSMKDKSLFLYVGRAQKRKRVDLLLKAFASIKDEIPKNVNIGIVGEGEENLNLKNLALEIGISDRVIFYGKITDDEYLKKIFSWAYAYVSPDAIGLGAQHSFAYGIPVVTAKNGFKGAEFDKLENNKNSILFQSQDELENVLLRLICEPELSQRLGANAFKLYSEKLNMNNMVSGFINAIEN